MPSPWTLIRSTLISIFSDIAVTQIKSAGGVHLPFETPAWEAEWKDRRARFIHPLQRCALYLKISGITGVGGDSVAYRMLDTGEAAGLPTTGVENMFETGSGMRKFTLQAQAWTTDEDEDVNSSDIIERCRNYLDMETSRQRLLAANIDFTDVGTSRDMTSLIDKKRFSITALDFIMTACVFYGDPIPVGYFDRIIVTSHEQEGGVDVNPSLRMIQESLPPEPDP